APRQGTGHLLQALVPGRQARLPGRPATGVELRARGGRALSGNRGTGAAGRAAARAARPCRAGRPRVRALILAAGRGERMRPLTDHTPKPLLEVAGKPLAAWHIERLAAAGVRDIVLNIAHLAELFPQRLGDGTRWGVRLHYSREEAGSLETGGGMLHALPLLGDAPFLVVNGDVWTDFDFASLPRQPRGHAHLVMVERPAEKAQGDFALDRDGLLHVQGAPLLTYSGVGVYRTQLLQDWRDVIGTCAGTQRTPPRFPLAPLLRAAMDAGAVTGQLHRGEWCDVGTPRRLAELERR